MTTSETYGIIGAARSGLAAARLLREHGATVFVSDAKSASESAEAISFLDNIGASYEFGGHTDRLLNVGTIVLSPGVPPTISIVREAREKGITITNEIEVAGRFSHGSIIGITGTNGKTTTTELIGHILRESGRKTFVAGNVGTPFSAIVGQTDDESVVVLELSSFQLEQIETLKPDVAILLNVTPDHLDRYESMDAYGEAKLRIAMNQESDDWCIWNADDPWLSRVESEGLRATTVGFSIERTRSVGAWVENGTMMVRMSQAADSVSVIPVDEIGIRGPHNLSNAMAAALATLRMNVPVEDVRSGLQSFRALPHRLEEVAVIDGVRYVNDSKGTNTDALRFALESFDAPIVLIAGGRAKKNRYDELIKRVRRRVKALVLVGEAADEMEEAFAGITPVHRAGYDMELAVDTAAGIAEPGDVILLSPACASFDMFRSFEHRGDVFRSLVMQRTGEIGDGA